MAVPVVTDIRAFQLQPLRFRSERSFSKWSPPTYSMRQARSCLPILVMTSVPLIERFTSLVKLSLKLAGTSEDPLH